LQIFYGRRETPELSERTPLGTPGANTLPENAQLADSNPAKEILGVQFWSKRDTFVDLAKHLLEIEKGHKK
jgi:hypothetical protein